MVMRISKEGLDFIKSYESFVPFLYDDLRYSKRLKYGYGEWDGGPLKGTLTIGYGHTADAKAKVDMSVGAKLSEEAASKILDIDLDEIEDWINSNIKVKLSQGMYDALVSFGFNCGIGNLRKLTRNLNNGDYKGTRAKFDEYVRSKGQFLLGLQRRRDGEQNLWDGGYETEVETPPTALPEAPVDHPAQVDTPTTPISTFEKVTTAVAPVIPVATAALADWKVAAVVAVAIILSLGGYLIYRKYD